MTKRRKIQRGDLQQVISEERRRVKSPTDESIRRGKRVLLKELLETEDERVFRDSIRAFGLQEDSPHWNDALKAWRDARRERELARRGRR